MQELIRTESPLDSSLEQSGALQSCWFDELASALPAAADEKPCENGKISDSELSKLTNDIVSKILWHGDFQYGPHRQRLERIFAGVVEKGEDAVKQLQEAINGELKARGSRLVLDSVFRCSANFMSGKFRLLDGAEEADAMAVLVPRFKWLR